MRKSRSPWRKVVVIVGLLLLIGGISIVQIVNGRYCFTPDAVSDFGFRLESTTVDEDGWTERTYVSDRPISEVREAIVKEFAERGYEVDRNRVAGFEIIGFSRAGWSKASLTPAYDKERQQYTNDASVFAIIETDEFIRRAMIVFGIRN